MAKLLSDNLAVCSFIGFFLFIGSIQLLADIVPKTTLPVVFVDSFTLEEKVIIKDAVKQHLCIWQADLDQTLKQVTIEVVKSPFKNDKGIVLVGQCNSEKRIIRVYVGKNLELPALYHEFCHLNVDSGGGHADPRWAQWEHRGAQVSQWVLYQRTEPAIK